MPKVDFTEDAFRGLIAKHLQGDEKLQAVAWGMQFPHPLLSFLTGFLMRFYAVGLTDGRLILTHLSVANEELATTVLTPAEIRGVTFGRGVLNVALNLRTTDGRIRRLRFQWVRQLPKNKDSAIQIARQVRAWVKG